MELEDEDFRYFAAMTEKEREKARNIEGRWLLSQAREELGAVGELIDRVQIVDGGVAASLDQAFIATGTLLPSTMVRTQLRLSEHYLRAADLGDDPALSSFVVLRAAIECTASAYWLMSGGSHRVNVERVLKRMWWDTESAAELAIAADASPDLSGVMALRQRITDIAGPIKRLDAESITESTRVRLSGLVETASRALRPDHPTMLYSTWMMCAAVSHGNIPVSAGAGLSAALIQEPSRHLIDRVVYAHLLSVAVAHLRTTVEFFESRAIEMHQHQRPDR